MAGGLSMDFLHTKKFSELTDLFLLAAKRCGVSLTVYTNCEILVDVQEKIKEKTGLCFVLG